MHSFSRSTIALQKCFFDDGVQKAVTKTRVTLSAEFTTPLLGRTSGKACRPRVGLAMCPSSLGGRSPPQAVTQTGRYVNSVARAQGLREFYLPWVWKSDKGKCCKAGERGCLLLGGGGALEVRFRILCCL